ncbi:RNA-directed DNA polymerase, eukaryota [Tanacetum coccineum]
MSCSNHHSNFSRKLRMSVRQEWKRKTSTPKSSPPSQNDSPPLLPRVYLQSSSPPSYNPLRDQMINQLHNISTILDSHNNPSNAYIYAPPSPPPQIHPPSHAQRGWSLGRNGTFTVKDARYRIDQNILPTLAHTTTWDKSIPRKVNVFMWRLSLDRLPHRLNLSSRGMDIPAISCPSCNANVESANHVFFECDIATDMWKLVFRWCDIPLFQASSWDSFNDWIISWHASKEKKHRFYVITTSVLWWLWRYRNSVTFSSQPLRKSDLFDNVRFSSFSWLHNRDHMKLSWNDWLMYPLSITRNGNG